MKIKAKIKTKTRIESDSMGPQEIPSDLYYGAQTSRAISNFKISGIPMPHSLIKAIAIIKEHAAYVNLELDLIKSDIAEAIIEASREVVSGRYQESFKTEVFQTGSGTSCNMNVNEVIASRANEILTGVRGGKTPVHPNDHVNLGQSSNDVIPSAIHIAALLAIKESLLPALQQLRNSLTEKSKEFRNIRKLGRTHLQDAVPMTLGQEFSGYARQIDLDIQRLKRCEVSLSELALGGTAVGTGLNTYPQFAKNVIERVSAVTKISFVEATNHFEAQAAQDSSVEFSGALKVVAVSLAKIANDLRWLSSGPRSGLGEINLPSLQPGSSIMPGKVNPVIPEAVVQVAAQVIGNDSVITLGALGGAFELNTMLPLIAYNLLYSTEILSNAARIFSELCIKGITVNEAKCKSYIEDSLSLSTALVPFIGYDKATEVSKKAFESKKTVREVAKKMKRELIDFSDRDIDRVIDESIMKNLN